jgi:hypothetical protein
VNECTAFRFGTYAVCAEVGVLYLVAFSCQPGIEVLFFIFYTSTVTSYELSLRIPLR